MAARAFDVAADHSPHTFAGSVMEGSFLKLMHAAGAGLLQGSCQAFSTCCTSAATDARAVARSWPWMSNSWYRV